MSKENLSFVFHAGALGDFITCLPAMNRWRELTPGAQYILAANPQTGQFACECAGFRQFRDVSAPSSAFLFGDNHERLTEFLSTFRSALLFTNNTHLRSAAEKAGLKPLLAQPPFPDEIISIYRYHSSLFTSCETEFGITIPPSFILKSFHIVPSERKFAVIHTGSGSRKKNWPKENYMLLADRLRDEGLGIVWITGPAENVKNLPPQDWICRNLPLPLLAAIMSRSSLYVGNDSGPTHLSAALGIPTVVIFGPSDPRIWKPAGMKVRVIQKSLPCSPCHGRAASPRCENECIKSIHVKEVLREVRSLLE
ncbi:MAG: glycosyltransferase family 9 protein [Chitinispirillaceae bacterium]